MDVAQYQTEELDQNGQPKKKGMSGKTIAIIVIVGVVGILVVKRLLGNAFTDAPDAAITPYDEGTIEEVLNAPQDGGYLLPVDTTPTTFTISSQTYTDTQVVSMANALHDRYAAIAEVIANSLLSDAQAVFETVIILFTSDGTTGNVTQGALDLYFQVLEVWAKRFDAASLAVAEGVARVAEAQIAGINAAVECTETIFVKDVVEESTTDETTVYMVEVNNTSGRGFLGMNKKKASSETRTAIKNFTRTDVRHISYIPHCIDWQVDITQLSAILAAGSLSMQMQYGILKTVLAMAPQPKNFIKKTT